MVSRPRSNFADDSKGKLTGGRFGIGAKATNVFSKQFKVEVVDAGRQKMLVQTWHNNMSTTAPAKVTTTKLKKSHVEIEWVPDMDRLGSCEQLLDVVRGRVIGLACTLPKGVKVLWNGEPVVSKTIVDWVCFLG